jgi:hypothetical protein
MCVFNIYVRMAGLKLIAYQIVKYSSSYNLNYRFETFGNINEQLV